MFLLFRRIAYETSRLVAVFSTHENAEKFVQKRIVFGKEDFVIEEWKVDPEIDT